VKNIYLKLLKRVFGDLIISISTIHSLFSYNAPRYLNQNFHFSTFQIEYTNNTKVSDLEHTKLVLFPPRHLLPLRVRREVLNGQPKNA
jgi:hypothetical protein